MKYLKNIIFVLVLCLGLGFTKTAFAAFAVVQASAQTIGTTAGIAVTVSATTARNLLVCTVSLRDLNETATSVTDDKGNVWNLSSAVDQSTNVRLYQAWSSGEIGGVTTITANYSGSASNKGVRCEEYSGAGANQIIVKDVATTGQGAADPVAVSTLTPAATGELVVASVENSGSVTWTAGATYTLNGAGTVFVMSEYKLSSASTETAPYTTSGTGNWAEIATAFKLAAQPAGGADNGDWFLWLMDLF